MTAFEIGDMVQVFSEMGTPMWVVSVNGDSYTLAYETYLEEPDITVVANQVTGWYDWRDAKRFSEFRRANVKTREEMFVLLGISLTADADTFHAAVSAYRKDHHTPAD